MDAACSPPWRRRCGCTDTSPDTLPKLTKYLHQRTGGMIGSLSHLVRAAALTAILDGTEQITRKLLDSTPVDHAAQSAAHGVA